MILQHFQISVFELMHSAVHFAILLTNNNTSILHNLVNSMDLAHKLQMPQLATYMVTN